MTDEVDRDAGPMLDRDTCACAYCRSGGDPNVYDVDCVYERVAIAGEYAAWRAALETNAADPDESSENAEADAWQQLLHSLAEREVGTGRIRDVAVVFDHTLPVFRRDVDDVEPTLEVLTADQDAAYITAWEQGLSVQVHVSDHASGENNVEVDLGTYPHLGAAVDAAREFTRWADSV